MEWHKKRTVQKGTLGERIVKTALENKGYIVYEPTTDKAHAFDFLAVKGKRVFVVAEVKSKARMNKFPATGIDVRHFNEYSFVMETQNMAVILFFVDEHPKEMRVYCQRLSELMKPEIHHGIEYPNFDIAKGIILFPISKMVHVCELTEEDAEELRGLSTRNYKYE